MSAVLTFVIPVRHPENSPDWAQLLRKLTQTIASIACQNSPGWRAVIVANRGATLPPLPPGFSVEWVDLPPNPHFERGASAQAEFYEGVRLDKGRRILAGLLASRESRFCMVVDDDDFISRHLTGHVEKFPESNGWEINDGLVWSDGGRLLYLHRRFTEFCGTSHIVRTSLFGLPDVAERASPAYVKHMLGSHRSIGMELAKAGTPLEQLPFTGAVYRIGHTGSHSKSRGVLATFVFNHRDYSLWRRAWNVTRLRVLTRRLRHEFFAGQA